MIAALLVTLVATEAVTIQPDASTLHYVGRWKVAKSGAKCAWPLSSVEISGKTSGLSVIFDASTPNDRWQIEIDGKATEVLSLKQGRHSYVVIPNQNKAQRRINLVRRTEAFSGPTEFKGFIGSASDEFIKVKRKRPLQIEIIGDSISAGFGVDGKSQTEKYSYDTANAYLTYGAVTARRLGAECQIIAWSGRKMWPDNTIPSIYDFILPEDSSTLYDRKKWPSQGGSGPWNPSAVVINLATNDFRTIPDETKWTGAYQEFVSKIRNLYPRSYIYLAIGPMMNDNFPPNIRALTTLRGFMTRMVSRIASKDPKVKLIEFETMNVQRDGSGSAWHPNAVTNALMADKLTAQIRTDLKLK